MSARWLAPRGKRRGPSRAETADTRPRPSGGVFPTKGRRMQPRKALWTSLALSLALVSGSSLGFPSVSAAGTPVDERYVLIHAAQEKAAREDAAEAAGAQAQVAPEAAPAAPPLRAAEIDERYAVLHRADDLDVATTGSIGARNLGGFRAKVDAGTIWVRESAPTRCLPGDLRQVVAEVAERFGEVRIMSTHRTPRHNRRVGGARGSLHLDCRAIDFRVAGSARAVMSFLRENPAVGGLKRYRNGIIHIDNGERRSW